MHYIVIVTVSRHTSPSCHVALVLLVSRYQQDDCLAPPSEVIKRNLIKDSVYCLKCTLIKNSINDCLGNWKLKCLLNVTFYQPLTDYCT